MSKYNWIDEWFKDNWKTIKRHIKRSGLCAIHLPKYLDGPAQLYVYRNYCKHHKCDSKLGEEWDSNWYTVDKVQMGIISDPKFLMSYYAHHHR